MPVETLQFPLRQPVRTALAATPPRLRPKGPTRPEGPDFYRQCPTAAGRPKQSAVERLEADKAKYVKSQVALSKQQPVRPGEVRRPLLNLSTTLRPTRKTPTCPRTHQGGVPLNLEHLSNLISGMSDGPLSTTTVISEGSHNTDCTTAIHNSPCPSPEGAEHRAERPCPPPCPDWCSPAKVRLQGSGAARAENPSSAWSPAAVAVRRVDVMPQARPARTPCRPQQYIRQTLQPVPLHFQFPLRQSTSNLRLFHPKTTPGPSPLKPDHPPSSPLGAHVPASPPPGLPLFPPSSPAITRLSSSSSRKRPSLTRSKSDMSDRCSRAGTELERFFNLCGVDPSELRELTGPGSDIVSMTRFRSASAPESECAGCGREEEDEEDGGAERVPYGVSVIERNARVIKWLYGLRQAKDNTSRSTNL